MQQKSLARLQPCNSILVFTDPGFSVQYTVFASYVVNEDFDEQGPNRYDI